MFIHVLAEILNQNCKKGNIDAAKERWDLRSIKEHIYQCNQTVAELIQHTADNEQHGACHNPIKTLPM